MAITLGVIFAVSPGLHGIGAGKTAISGWGCLILAAPTASLAAFLSILSSPARLSGAHQFLLTKMNPLKIGLQGFRPGGKV